MASHPLLRIGTRGSDLALAQAALVEAALRHAFPGTPVERVVIHTTGDNRQDIRLTDFSSPSAHGRVADKGIFIKELEMALQAGRIDLAVHSLKDVPTELDPAFLVAGVLPRASVEDVLLSSKPLPAGLDSLSGSARVATSSVRRRRMLLAARPDLVIEEIRGNVPTRLRKLVEHGAPEALVLARAGLERLGWEPAGGSIRIDGRVLHAAVLPEKSILPAAGQGVIGLEIRTEDEASASAVAAINHAPTWACVRLEREFLRLLHAGCHTPVGISTRITGDRICAQAILFREDAPGCSRGQAAGPVGSPEGVASLLLGAMQPETPPPS